MALLGVCVSSCAIGDRCGCPFLGPSFFKGDCEKPSFFEATVVSFKGIPTCGFPHSPSTSKQNGKLVKGTKASNLRSMENHPPSPVTFGCRRLQNSLQGEGWVRKGLQYFEVDFGFRGKLGQFLHYAPNLQTSRSPPPPVLLLVTPIDLFAHSADMFGSRPFKSFVQSFDTWYSDKKACRPLHRVHSQHKPPGTIHPPILHIGILDWTKSTTSTTTGYQFPSGIGTPAVGLNLW